MDCELHIKVTILYDWYSLRCNKICIVICYRGLKFPQKALVFLLLDGDAACTSLNGHSAWKCSVLVLVWCCKSTGDKEQCLWRYWPPEGCNKKWYDKPTHYGCFSKKCWLGEQWSSDISVFWNVSKQSNIQSENTRFETLWFSPLTRISIYVVDSSLLCLLFLRSLSILWGCPIINIRSSSSSCSSLVPTTSIVWMFWPSQHIISNYCDPGCNWSNSLFAELRN